MSRLLLKDVLKIYPYTRVSGVFGRKKAREALEREKLNPYTTNEGVVAVQKFNLEVEDGEFIVLLGPSGCGKTTVLRMIAGLEDISSGEIYMDGVLTNDLNPEHRDIAMIFQNYALYSHLTVYDNLAFPLRNLHIPRDEVDRMVLSTADNLNLTHLLGRLPRELSGGERQRVAIGRCIVRNPKIFLMDEPFSNLDAPLRRKLRVVVKNLHKKTGTTFIYVTHDQFEAFSLADRIVVMRDGIIEQTGTPRELYNEPANLYTATLVGSPRMNIFNNAELDYVSNSSNRWTVNVLGNKYPLSESMTRGFSKDLNGAAVTLGIRPVHVQVSSNSDSSAGSGIPAKVLYTEHMGSETHIYMEVNDLEVIAVQPSVNPQYSAFHRGQSVFISFQMQKVHLFDRDTGSRI